MHVRPLQDRILVQLLDEGEQQIGGIIVRDATFFSRAAMQEPSSSKARLLDSIARRFETWRQYHTRLSRGLRDQPLLLAPPKPAGSTSR